MTWYHPMNAYYSFSAFSVDHQGMIHSNPTTTTTPSLLPTSSTHQQPQLTNNHSSMEARLIHTPHLAESISALHVSDQHHHELTIFKTQSILAPLNGHPHYPCSLFLSNSTSLLSMSHETRVELLVTDVRHMCYLVACYKITCMSPLTTLTFKDIVIADYLVNGLCDSTMRAWVRINDTTVLPLRVSIIL